MVVVDKVKRSKAAADEEDSEHIDDKLVLSIEKLQEIQDELEKVNEEASIKVLEVEQKYNEIRRPVYLKRNQIIQSIPDFWLTALLSHPALGDLLTEEDQMIFKYLVSIDVEDFKDVKSGYCISFTFTPNPYFEDTKLTKAFSFADDGTTNVTGTTIKWKEGMELANGDAHEKIGTKRPFAEESFFSWFGETQPKSMSEVSEVITDEVADIIKEDLWPNPLKYFNNEADEEDDFDGDDDDDENASEDDEDEEDDE